jgi:predicted PurR-regulated permease PerM
MEWYRYPHVRLAGFACGVAFITLLALFFLRVLMVPILLSILFAYLTHPLFNALERKGLGRTTAVMILLTASVVLGFLLFWFVLPVIVSQFRVFFSILPEAIQTFEQIWLPRIKQFISDSIGGTPLPFEVGSSMRDFFPASEFKPLEFFLSSVGAGTQLIFSLAIFLVGTPIFSFFVTRHYQSGISWIQSFVPSDLRPSVFRFAADVDATLRSVLSGQILVVAVLSALYATSFFLVGLPGGLAIGIITGLSRIVPYLDLIVGGTLSLLICVSSGSPIGVLVGIAISFLIIQLLDGLVLTPRIVGQFAGLHPVIIIMAVLCFADWLGFYGVLLAIPSTAVARVLAVNLIRTYKHSRFFLAANNKP